MSTFRCIAVSLVLFHVCLTALFGFEQNTISNSSALKACPSNQNSRFEFIDNNYFGLNVQNYSGDFIGRPFSKNAPWMSKIEFKKYLKYKILEFPELKMIPQLCIALSLLKINGKVFTEAWIDNTFKLPANKTILFLLNISQVEITCKGLRIP